MEFVFLILGMTAVTYGTRLSMIFILGRWSVPQMFMRALVYVPMAAFAAIIVPELVRLDTTGWVIPPARFVAGVVAILVALITRHVLLTIVVGMGTLWTIQFLVGR